MKRFPNRYVAGLQLAERIKRHLHYVEPLILALPRGGVAVAAPIADRLDYQMELFLVRKLGVPGHEELAFGAIASGNITVLNKEILAEIPLSQDEIQKVIARERNELKRREQVYRGDSFPVNVTNRDVIIVDDGIATGATMKAAIKALYSKEVSRLAVAVPVAPGSASQEFALLVDNFICLNFPETFMSVGSWYEDFPQVTDDEVITLLSKTHNVTPKKYEGHIPAAT